MSAEDSLEDLTRYGSPTVEEAVVQGQLLALSRFDIPTPRYASSPPSASRDRR